MQLQGIQWLYPSQMSAGMAQHKEKEVEAFRILRELHLQKELM
jgi:hypothetical protein